MATIRRGLVYIFILTVALVISVASTAQANYCFSSLDIPGATDTWANGINNSGNIVGGYNDSGIFFGTHGFLYAGGNFTSVDVLLPGATDRWANGINNSGNIVGWYMDPEGNYHGFLHAGGSFTSIDAGEDTWANGINDSGKIVGDCYNGISTTAGFVYSGGKFTSIQAVPGGLPTQPYGINNFSIIVGTYNRSHGFVYAGGNFTFIDFPGAFVTQAYGINNSGNIVGSYSESIGEYNEGYYHGFLYAGGSFTSIDFPGAKSTSANGINDSGKIVGSYEDANGKHHGFIATSCNPTLTVLKSGTGNGTVTSSPAGINCGPDCSESYIYGTVVTLTATPATGSAFTGWSGDFSGTSNPTSITMDADETVTATFTASTPTQYSLTVLKSGTGTGTVSSNPSGINCGVDCSETYSKVQKVRLTAKADANSIFAGWAGACSGTGPCQVTVNGPETVTASFTLKTPHISLAQTSLDVGNIRVGKKVAKALKITNNGSGDLVITLSGLVGTDFNIQGVAMSP